MTRKYNMIVRQISTPLCAWCLVVAMVAVGC
ncbi:hypothetical protein CCACVL1_06323 [Corchorus capsularis]|uniref:Uncharacterized protein n=1 Tax=Corchorus capsularis TaxID=210143 RepID=A0A1R3JG93_COCAP|nr:hypothetical protein CCACVL1_06323 [Corchorus capsularis]